MWSPWRPTICPGDRNFLTRPGLGHHTRTREELLWRANDVLGWIESGEVKLHIGGAYALTEAAEAHRALASRQTMGKLVLLP